jgi:toxin ParE1/3/4
VARVVWAPSALNDLAEVWRFIERDSSRSARVTVIQIQESAERLAVFPLSGRVVPEHPAAGLREIIVAPYRVIYTYELPEDRVVILAVTHGRRRLPADLV